MSKRLPTLYTVDEVAEIVKRSPSSLYQLRYLDARRQPHERRGPRWRKIGGRVMVTESDLTEWLEGEQHEIAPAR